MERFTMLFECVQRKLKIHQILREININNRTKKLNRTDYFCYRRTFERDFRLPSTQTKVGYFRLSRASQNAQTNGSIPK